MSILPDFGGCFRGLTNDGWRRTQHGFQAQNLRHGPRRGSTSGNLDKNGLRLPQDGFDVDGTGHVVDVFENLRESKFIFDQNVFLGVEESDANEEVEVAARMPRPQYFPQPHYIGEGKFALEMN